MMHTLETGLRNKLHTAVLRAREIAEQAAKASLQSLGVGQPVVPAHLSEEQRALRRRLRAHGRQLGDIRYRGGPKKDAQEIGYLLHEIAYEHWHRMLFARFLAENVLLMHPDGVAVSLEECEELAEYEGANSGWELAGRYAGSMLPQVFRIDSPALALSFPREHQRQLEKLLSGLDQEIFMASDSLGWVYQFWQTSKKEEVNRSEVKIGAKELPAVTQLFTEPYMVSFLLDNSLGAWWAARRLTEEDFEYATNEEELREKASIPGVPLEYLRFVQDDQGKWAPAAGSYENWPEHLGELKTLDPCCGSGHFLVAALHMLVPMRMELDGLNAKDTVDAVLRENLHGLEIDQRCVELAAFALALAAWKYPGAEGYRPLPELNLACSGLSLNMSKEHWTSLAPYQSKFRNSLNLLYDNFQMAPTLGSLLNPCRSEAINLVDLQELLPYIENLLLEERNEEIHETAISAQGLAQSTKMLLNTYELIVTNVPYLTRGKQNEILKGYIDEYHRNSKNELATVFLERCFELCAENGVLSIVMPQNWFFLSSYKKLRRKLLNKCNFEIIVQLGGGAESFNCGPGNITNISLLILLKNIVNSNVLHHQSHNRKCISHIDVSFCNHLSEKSKGISTAEPINVYQKNILDDQDSRIVIRKNNKTNLLQKHAKSYEGLTTGDINRFVLNFWEIQIRSYWIYYIQNSSSISHYSGRTDVIYWGKDGEYIKKFPGSYIKGFDAWGNFGLRVTQMDQLPVTIFTGEIFGKSAATIIPYNLKEVAAIWCFCASPEFNKEVRKIDQKLNVTIATLVKVPYERDYWKKIADAKYPHGLPKPYSDDPTQWIFHGHPCGSVIWDEESKWTTRGSLRSDETVLHVAVARLLGYRWPAEQDPDMELAEESREWVNRCQDLLSLADDDGIVCIPSVHGEARASERLIHMLEKAYGEAWNPAMLSKLLTAVGCSGKDLDHWLREKFFEQHCRIFHHRPFIWHIWDGLKDGFAVLVNYHKLNRHNLERLIYTYLGNWIRSQERAQAEGVDGADEKVAAAEGLKKRLEAILHGEKPLDIFVRWKPLEEQPIGWEPDLNDGVRLNIRPFVYVDDVRYKGAGVLRKKPNIKWNKDRGKDVESAPWYHLFKGERINDHHLGLAEKKEAREKTKKG